MEIIFVSHSYFFEIISRFFYYKLINLSYSPLEDGSLWTSLSCTLVFQDVMYHIQDNMFTIDLFNWETVDMGPVPDFARRQGKCAVTTINGNSGRACQLIPLCRNILLFS